jgi:hypothetical protein
MYNNGLLKVDLEKLYKEYFNNEFKDLTPLKLEKCFNDFRILLRLIQNYKISYFKNTTNESSSNNLISGIGKLIKGGDKQITQNLIEF